MGVRQFERDDGVVVSPGRKKVVGGIPPERNHAEIAVAVQNVRSDLEVTPLLPVGVCFHKPGRKPWDGKIEVQAEFVGVDQSVVVCIFGASDLPFVSSGQFEGKVLRPPEDVTVA